MSWVKSVFVVALGVALGLVLSGRASADVGVAVLTRVVPVGGVIVGHGDGSGLPVYLVAAALGPRRDACRQRAICEPSVASTPRSPFVLLGHLHRTKDTYAWQRFTFPLPPTVRPGLYRMYLYCRPCGGSLIQSGTRVTGETIRVTKRPSSRSIVVSGGRSRTRFVVSEPAGVVLLLRVWVPHGDRVSVSGTIPGLAGVAVFPGRMVGMGACHRRGRYDICTQPEEWCPMPAAAWHFLLTKTAGRPGVVRLRFVVGRPPTT